MAIMKNLFSGFLFLLVISCSYVNNEKDKRLVGDWGIYVSVFDSTSIMCNVCPRIYFKRNRKAILILPSGQKEYYDWLIIEENKVRIELHSKDINDTYFKEALFDFKLNKKEEFDELIISLDETNGYILRR